METLRSRYVPEFRIAVTIGGQPPLSGVQIAPATYTAQNMRNYGVVSTRSNGAVLCSVRQLRNGGTWSAAADLTEANVFAFALRFTDSQQLSSLDFYGQGTGLFGRRILYVNNLSLAGVIDSNLSGNTVRLTSGTDVALTDAASVSAGIPGVQFVAGDYTQFQAGRLRAGTAITFPINQPIPSPAQRAALDLSSEPRGSYVLRLQGAAPQQERVVLDPAIAGDSINGVIEIFRDTWNAPAQPRNYTLNFTIV
jgi:hypothetical protein